MHDYHACMPSPKNDNSSPETPEMVTTDSTSAMPTSTENAAKPMIAFRIFAVAVIALAIIAVVLLRADADKDWQRKNIHTAIALLIAGSAMIVWMLGLSRWHWKRRGLVVLIVAALVGTAAATLEVESPDGDLVPIVRWKWNTYSDRDLAPLTIQANTDGDNKGGNNSVGAADAADPKIPGLIDFPQFLGPARNAKLGSPILAKDWSAAPPREVWRKTVGAGWGGFAVVGHRAITQEQRGDSEMVVCYDIRNGDALWKHEDQTRYDTKIGGVGPRATPTIEGDHVYTHGGTGTLNCLDFKTGKLIWSRNTLKDAHTSQPEWGVAGSPLVVDDMIVINAGPPGGSLLAYNRTDGKKRWAAGRDVASYSSPLLANIAGQRQILILNHGSVTAHDVENGSTLWSHPWPGAQPKVAQPVVLPGDRVFITSGYGVGCEMIHVTHDKATNTFSTERLFKNIKLRAKFTNVIHHDGFIYGLNDGTLVCLNAETGQWEWRGKRFGHGQLLFVNGTLLIQAEAGHIALVAAKSDTFEELATHEVFDDKTWNNPTLAGRYLLLRNDREAVCLEVPIGN